MDSIIKTPDVDSVLRFLRQRSPRRSPLIHDGREARTNIGGSLTPRDRAEVDRFYLQRHQTDEAVKLDEANKEAVKRDGEHDATSLEEQIGRPLTCDVICARLSKLNPNFIFERSKAYPDIMGIYYPDAKHEGHKRHLCGFEFGYSPEFTVFCPEAEGAKKMTRGWQALVLILARRGYIEYTRAAKLFEVERTRGSAKLCEERQRLSRPAKLV